MTQTPHTERTHYPRFSAAQRFEHFVLLVVVLGLALTGLPQKFAGEQWARTLIRLLGGIESVRILHRFLALLLVAEVIYHVGAVAYRLFVLRQPATLRPRSRDLRDLRDWVLYNLGRRAEQPTMPRYNFSNKITYWLIVLSLAILLITGFMLWNPVATASILPGEAIPAAQVAHSNQALLTILVIVVWHLYGVLIGRFNASIFSGRLSRKAMLADHAEELQQLDKGEPPVSTPAEAVAARRRLFVPVAALILIALVAGLVWFVTFERTALATVPRQNAESVAIFAPQVKPAAGDASVGAAIWPTVRCAICHGPQAGGGPDGAPALKGTALTFDKFYQQVRTGRDKMPAFRPEELPDGYLLHIWTWLSKNP